MDDSTLPHLVRATIWGLACVPMQGQILSVQSMLRLRATHPVYDRKAQHHTDVERVWPRDEDGVLRRDGGNMAQACGTNNDVAKVLNASCGFSGIEDAWSPLALPGVHGYVNNSDVTTTSLDKV